MKALVFVLALSLASAAAMPATALAQSPMQDRTFVTTMLQISLAQIAYAKLAQTKGTSTGTRALASRALSEWTDDTQTPLRAIAAAYKWTAPTALTAAQNATLTALQDESGTDFDRDYTNAVILDYSRAIAMDGDEQNSSDDALHAFAEGILGMYIQTRDLARNNLGF
ncbi:MAG: DUF4142 domain-containing protein [Candidatus Eremiobacteraeota bacterium]|nr:DUF4142 domain-containing protein [Candidatus Eremiobacteraeota bacterium]